MSSLHRGSACIRCRTRKVRCDGNRPTCGPCRRRGDDCQFDGEATQSQVLEQQIDTLKSRLEALENTPHSTSTYPSSFPSNPPPFGGFPLPDGWWNSDELPTSLSRYLLDTFFSYSPTTWFFLNVPRFMGSFNISAPIGHHARPSTALINAIYLWGIALSQDTRLKSYEPVFLSRAIHHSQQALSGDHPQKETHTIQTEILLSLYFFQAGHISEGISHLNAAVSIAVTCRYHQIHNFQSPFALSVGVDVVGEGEITNAFWATYLIDKGWSTAANFASGFPDEGTENGRIDTPWPLDMAQYESDILQQYGRGTVKRFLEDPSASYANEDASFFAMHCKAAVLFERATIFASDMKNDNIDFHGKNLAAIHEQFVDFNQGIEKFYSTISPVNAAAARSDSIRTLIVVHSLTLSAIINLNNSVHMQYDCSWNEKCIAAAVALVTLLDNIDLNRLVYVDPIMGNLWFKAGEVLIRESARLVALRNKTASPRELVLGKTLDRLTSIMNIFAAKSPNISSRCIALHHARAKSM